MEIEINTETEDEEEEEEELSLPTLPATAAPEYFPQDNPGRSAIKASALRHTQAKVIEPQSDMIVVATTSQDPRGRPAPSSSPTRAPSPTKRPRRTRQLSNARK